MTIDRHSRQCGGGGFMTWGMLMPNGLISVKVLREKVNSSSYIKLLETYAVPIMNLNLKPNYYFVQDNCSIHVSRISKEFLEKQSFQVVNWPSRSPDLNLMENVWRMLSSIVYDSGQSRNIKDLEEKIVKAVLTINSEKIDITKGLYSSFRKRLTSVMMCKGNIYKSNE